MFFFYFISYETTFFNIFSVYNNNMCCGPMAPWPSKSNEVGATICSTNFKRKIIFFGPNFCFDIDTKIGKKILKKLPKRLASYWLQFIRFIRSLLFWANGPRGMSKIFQKHRFRNVTHLIRLNIINSMKFLLSKFWKKY